MKAVKENKVYTIDESQRKAYAAQGYDITDDRGKIIEYAVGKTVPYAKYAALLEENKRLKKQLAEAGGNKAAPPVKKRK